MKTVRGYAKLKIQCVRLSNHVSNDKHHIVKSLLLNIVKFQINVKKQKRILYCFPLLSLS